MKRERLINRVGRTKIFFVPSRPAEKGEREEGSRLYPWGPGLVRGPGSLFSASFRAKIHLNPLTFRIERILCLDRGPSGNEPQGSTWHSTALAPS